MMPLELALLNKVPSVVTSVDARKKAIRRNPTFTSLLAKFEPITLDEMAGVALLDRMDTKFVMSEAQLAQALTGLEENYWVLEVDGVRQNHYRTMYFDTPDFMLYHRHHAGGRNRYKVRCREYVDSHQSFLEVKFKVNKAHTVKSRLQTSRFLTQFTNETYKFMDAHFPFAAEYLEPKLWNEYFRVTLVNRHTPERLTLDLNLRLFNETHSVTLPGVAIAEVKRARHDTSSTFFEQMRALNLRPMGFSKYCMGINLLYGEVKANRFKPRLRHVEQILSAPARTHSPLGDYYVH